MDRPDLPLNALRVFEVAMRQGSFTKAAIELRVTQAAVSHQVARLEDLLGTALFLRTSQGLIPTDEGRLLFPVLEHGFDAMSRVLDRLGGRRDIEVLKVGVNSASSPFEPFVSVLGFMLHDGHPSGCLPMSAALSAHGRLGGG